MTWILKEESEVKKRERVVERYNSGEIAHKMWEKGRQKQKLERPYKFSSEETMLTFLKLF